MKQEREVEQESDEEEEITVDVPYQYEDFEIVEKEVRKLEPNLNKMYWPDTVCFICETFT